MLHVLSHFQKQRDESGDGFALQQMLLNFIVEKQAFRRRAGGVVAGEIHCAVSSGVKSKVPKTAPSRRSTVITCWRPSGPSTNNDKVSSSPVMVITRAPAGSATSYDFTIDWD